MIAAQDIMTMHRDAPIGPSTDITRVALIARFSP